MFCVEEQLHGENYKNRRNYEGFGHKLSWIKAHDTHIEPWWNVHVMSKLTRHLTAIPQALAQLCRY